MSKEKKIFVLDTNILTASPYALFAFDEHDVALPHVVIEELDNLKNMSGDTGVNVRTAIRQLEQLRLQGSLTEGVALPGGGQLYVADIPETHQQEALRKMERRGWDPKKADNQILAVAYAKKAMTPDNVSVIVVSNDINMRLKAEIIGIRAEEFRTDKIREGQEQYTGRAELTMRAGAINAFYDHGFLLTEDVYDTGADDEPVFYENMFITMHDVADPQSNALGIIRGGRIEKLRYSKETPYGITPRNAGQRFMMEAMLTPVDEMPLVIIKGPAGTGKTHFALACGLEQTLVNNEYRNVFLSRPNQKMDEDIGFLRGSEQEKIAPLLRPYMDNLELLTQDKEPNYVQFLFEKGCIVAEAMAYMRGRSITNTWMILDEMQNSTAMQAFSIVSRAGVGSKVILMGDPYQIDNPRLDASTCGISFTTERMKLSNKIPGQGIAGILTLEETECQRSRLAMAAIRYMQPKGLMHSSPLRA